MTGRLYTTTFVIPAGTLINAPVTVPVALDDAVLDQVDIVIPPGHAGLTGIRILWAGAQIMPYNVGGWLSGDDEEIPFKYGSEVTASGLQLQGYNTDVFSHGFNLRWHVSDLVTVNPVVISSPQASTSGGTVDQTPITGLSGVVAIPDATPAGI